MFISVAVVVKKYCIHCAPLSLLFLLLLFFFFFFYQYRIPNFISVLRRYRHLPHLFLLYLHSFSQIFALRIRLRISHFVHNTGSLHIMCIWNSSRSSQGDIILSPQITSSARCKHFSLKPKDWRNAAVSGAKQQLSSDIQQAHRLLLHSGFYSITLEKSIAPLFMFCCPEFSSLTRDWLCF
jgi:hypothetical protein